MFANSKYAAILFSGLIGCATVSPTFPANSQTDMRAVDANSNRVEMALPSQLERIDVVKFLQPGQYFELTYKEPIRPEGSPGANQDSPEFSKSKRYAGRVVRVENRTVVLEETIRCDIGESREAKSTILARVPLLRSMVKRPDSVEVTPLEGPVRLPLSSLHLITTIAPNTWPAYRTDGFQRVGIEFN